MVRTLTRPTGLGEKTEVQEQESLEQEVTRNEETFNPASSAVPKVSTSNGSGVAALAASSTGGSSVVATQRSGLLLGPSAAQRVMSPTSTLLGNNSLFPRYCKSCSDVMLLHEPIHV